MKIENSAAAFYIFLHFRESFFFLFSWPTASRDRLVVEGDLLDLDLEYVEGDLLDLDLE
jgi:hypothetical protein